MGVYIYIYAWREACVCVCVCVCVAYSRRFDETLCTTVVQLYDLVVVTFVARETQIIKLLRTVFEAEALWRLPVPHDRKDQHKRRLSPLWERCIQEIWVWSTYPSRRQ